MTTHDKQQVVVWRATTAVVFTICTFCAVSLFIAQAQEIPFGVSPKMIEESGDITIGEKQLMGTDAHNNLLMSYEYKIGNRIGVEVDEVHYALQFWNVGKMGGTSGYLFWKKDFGKATLTVTPIASTPGSAITEEVDNSKLKLPNGYKLEPAENTPELVPSNCALTFSGGPRGTFEGFCASGEKITGSILSGGGATFTITVAEKTPLALQWLNKKELHFSGEPFSDWKFDESQLEDSGARFSSISGEVEVRHDKDTAWEFAKLDTPLYVIDHVKTGEESQAIIGFADLSTFLLKEESEIVITTPPKKDSKLKLVLGTITANVKKMMTDGTMEVEMSQAVAGIKGTRFALTETGSESTIEVSEGTVEFRSKTDGTTVMVGAGETVTANATGLKEKHAFDPHTLDAEIIAATDVLPAPATTEVPDQESAPTHQKTESTSKAPTYALWVVLLAMLTGGVWVMKNRKRNNF